MLQVRNSSVFPWRSHTWDSATRKRRQGSYFQEVRRHLLGIRVRIQQEDSRDVAGNIPSIPMNVHSDHELIFSSMQVGTTSTWLTGYSLARVCYLLWAGWSRCQCNRDRPSPGSESPMTCWLPASSSIKWGQGLHTSSSHTSMSVEPLQRHNVLALGLWHEAMLHKELQGQGIWSGTLISVPPMGRIKWRYWLKEPEHSKKGPCLTCSWLGSILGMSYGPPQSHQE